jgi:methylated-DNA-[protein]-cysteine S-methyltransferase
MALKLVEMNDIRFAYYQSPIGLIKICGTDTYISEVLFINDEDDLAGTTAYHPLLHQCIEQLIEYFNGNRLSFDIPIHQKGTDFQQKVWNELTSINFGKTVSYLALAKRLGDPNCIRAAASTNGKNHVCIIIPCHRVIGSNQSLVGYAGGLARKRWLLEHENKVANGVQTFF